MYIFFPRTNCLKQPINLLGIMDKGNKKDNSKVYTEIKINVDTSDAHTTGERQNITLFFSVTSWEKENWTHSYTYTWKVSFWRNTCINRRIFSIFLFNVKKCVPLHPWLGTTIVYVSVYN